MVVCAEGGDEDGEDDGGEDGLHDGVAVGDVGGECEYGEYGVAEAAGDQKAGKSDFGFADFEDSRAVV